MAGFCVSPVFILSKVSLILAGLMLLDLIPVGLQ